MEVVFLSALEMSAPAITLESIAAQNSMIMRCLRELKEDQRQRWDEQHRANVRIHERLDEIMGKKYVTLAECERRCRGVNPYIAYVAIPVLTVVVTWVMTVLLK